MYSSGDRTGLIIGIFLLVIVVILSFFIFYYRKRDPPLNPGDRNRNSPKNNISVSDVNKNTDDENSIDSLKLDDDDDDCEEISEDGDGTMQTASSFSPLSESEQ